MKIYVLILLALLLILVNSISCEYSESGELLSSYPSSHSKRLDGIWKSKRKWTYYWVKEWEEKKVYIPIWKKIWSPVEINEWIPVPNTPPHK